jgi:hypothetical protein
MVSAMEFSHQRRDGECISALSTRFTRDATHIQVSPLTSTETLAI